MIHDLKTIDYYYDLVDADLKPFEIRFNDRGFLEDDILHLIRVDKENLQPTGKHSFWKVLCIIDYQQKPGFIVMGIKRDWTV